MSAISRWSRTSKPMDTSRTREPTRLTPSSQNVNLAIDSVEVRWDIARSALNGTAPGGRSRMLSMTLLAESLAGGSGVVSVEFADATTGERSVLHRRVSAQVEVIGDIRGHVHVEIPGWLHATIGPGRDGDTWRLVYARTPILAQLNVPGGRAEPVGVTVTTT